MTIVAGVLPVLAEEVVTFAAAGDHGHTAAAEASLRLLAASRAAFYLALGDLSYGSVGAERAWCDFVAARVGPAYPFQLVSGNHEDDGMANGFIGTFAECLPDRMKAVGTYGAEYYFDYRGLVRIIMISPNLRVYGADYAYGFWDPYTMWLSNAIDTARSAGIPWVIVGMHKNCLTMGEKSCEIGSDLMNMLIFKKVDLVLQAHDHTYQRSKQLRFSPSCPYLVPETFNPNCVGNQGAAGTYVKGEGPIFVITGTFGVDLHNIYPADPEAGYFVTAMGANRNPTHGFTRYAASATELSAQFLGIGDGPFTDRFTITSSGGLVAAR
jgi:hypothetical protein